MGLLLGLAPPSLLTHIKPSARFWQLAFCLSLHSISSPLLLTHDPDLGLLMLPNGQSPCFGSPEGLTLPTDAYCHHPLSGSGRKGFYRLYRYRLQLMCEMCFHRLPPGHGIKSNTARRPSEVQVSSPIISTMRFHSSLLLTFQV